jgi:uracil-DNA glycosylase
MFPQYLSNSINALSTISWGWHLIQFNNLIPNDWWNALTMEIPEGDFQALEKKISAEYESGRCISPKPNSIFAALHLTPLTEVKVVILGQDPYPGTGEAHGLAFSIPRNVTRIPGSLRNIFKELEDDLGIHPPPSGDLSKWAQRGVLLLNTVLTVECGKIDSHKRLGWHIFTNAILNVTLKNNQNTSFVLWGNKAKKYAKIISKFNNNQILIAPHPSARSAKRGFFGCKHFSFINNFRRDRGMNEIDWTL